MGYSASAMLGGDYLKSEFLKNKGPMRGTIAGVALDSFAAQPGKAAEQKLAVVIDFGAEEKKVTLNKSNLRIIASAYGDDTDKWTGKPIVIYFDPNVQFGGRAVGGIRVKVATQQPSLAQQQQVANQVVAAQVATGFGAELPVTSPTAVIVVQQPVVDDDIPF